MNYARDYARRTDCDKNICADICADLCAGRLNYARNMRGYMHASFESRATLCTVHRMRRKHMRAYMRGYMRGTIFWLSQCARRFVRTLPGDARCRQQHQMTEQGAVHNSAHVLLTARGVPRAYSAQGWRTCILESINKTPQTWHRQLLRTSIFVACATHNSAQNANRTHAAAHISVHISAHMSAHISPRILIYSTTLMSARYL